MVAEAFGWSFHPIAPFVSLRPFVWEPGTTSADKIKSVFRFTELRFSVWSVPETTQRRKKTMTAAAHALDQPSYPFQSSIWSQLYS